MNEIGLPDLATKQDLERLRHDLTARMFGIMATANGFLFALLKLTS